MYMTDEERKKPLSHYIDGFTFESCLDLSCGVKVYGWQEGYESALTQAVADFSVWWALNFHSHLNGFSGMDTVMWKIT